jgi:hypothetical protein
MYGTNKSLELVELEHTFHENLIQALREVLYSRLMAIILAIWVKILR